MKAENQKLMKNVAKLEESNRTLLEVIQTRMKNNNDDYESILNTTMDESAGKDVFRTL